MQDKTITVISTTNFTLFKGLSQKDLSGKNPAEHNRLNIRPTWSHGLDEQGRIQRFDFVAGENQCPEYICEWNSFKKMCDGGTLSIKGSYTKKSTTNSADASLLERIKALEEENEKLKAEKQEESKEVIKGKKIEEC
jgi:hypothetical protein